jgi:hypothetical protein
MSVAEAVTLIGAVTAAIVAILSAVVQAYTAARVNSVHGKVDGQTAQIANLSEKVGEQRGLVAGLHAADLLEPKSPPVG